MSIRCINCGKFIAYKDIPKKIKVYFTPDTHFTIEKTEYEHKKCRKK